MDKEAKFSNLMIQSIFNTSRSYINYVRCHKFRSIWGKSLRIRDQFL